MLGKYVLSWHKIRNHKDTPYTGQIVGEVGNYWLLDVGGDQVRALKAACSTVPVKHPSQLQETK